MKIRTTVEQATRPPTEFIWEGDDYHDDPYGEAIAVLLNHDPHLTHNQKVVLYPVTGEVLTYERVIDVASDG